MNQTEDHVTLAEADLPTFIVEYVKLHGGITIHTKSATLKQSGFAVSPYGHREEQYPLADFTPDHVRAFISKDFLFLLPGHYLGVWVDGPTVYLDVSVIVDDEADARTIGEGAGQLAYFDLNTGRTVRLK